MKRFVVIIHCIICCSLLYSQTDKYFIKIIGYPAPSYEDGRTISQDKNGNYFLMIGRGPFSSYKYFPVFIKLDKYGSILWVKDIYDSLFYRSVLVAMAKKGDNSFLFTGWRTDITDKEWYNYIVKIDTSGEIVWSKIIGDTLLVERTVGIKPINDNESMLIGNKNDSANYEDANIIIIDSLGNVKWDTTMGDFGRHDGFGWVEQAEDSGYILSGLYNYLIYQGQGWWVKVDKSWNIVFDKKFTIENVTSFGKFIVTKDGSYIINCAIGYDFFSTHAYLLKLNSEAEIEWKKPIRNDTALYFYSAVNNILQLSDEKYIVVGSIDIDFNNRDILLSKVDTNGLELWRRTYGDFYEKDDDYGYNMDTTSDGGFIITGRTKSTGGIDAFIIKTNCAGFAGPPLAKFNIIQNGKEVFFANNSDSAVSYKWFFGDGDSLVYDWDKSWVWIRHAPPDTFTHTFADTGTYTITLIAGACGEWDTLTQTISILPTAISKTETPPTTAQIKINPNPMYDVISIEDQTNELLSFNLFDITGKKIISVLSQVSPPTNLLHEDLRQHGQATQHTNQPHEDMQLHGNISTVRTINISMLPTGIYIYRIMDKVGNVSFGKVVKM